MGRGCTGPSEHTETRSRAPKIAASDGETQMFRLQLLHGARVSGTVIEKDKMCFLPVHWKKIDLKIKFSGHTLLFKLSQFIQLLSNRLQKILCLHFRLPLDVHKSISSFSDPEKLHSQNSVPHFAPLEFRSQNQTPSKQDLALKASSPDLKTWKRLTCEERARRENNCLLLRVLPSPPLTTSVQAFSPHQICSGPGARSPRLARAHAAAPKSLTRPSPLLHKCSHHTAGFLKLQIYAC